MKFVNFRAGPTGVGPFIDLLSSQFINIISIPGQSSPQRLEDCKLQHWRQYHLLSTLFRFLKSKILGEKNFSKMEISNVRVVCRVRPRISDEVEFLPCLSISSNTVRVECIEGRARLKESLPGSSNLSQRMFHFDRVFGEACGQSDIFEEVSPLVESALSGFTSTVFAYGPTGSGKSHTMLGTSQQPGVISHAIRQLFNPLVANRVVTMSFVELYNDQFIDLLADSGVEI